MTRTIYRTYMDRILTLAEYLTMKMAEYKTSPGAVERNSEGAPGGKVSKTTVYDLANDRAGSPSVNTLKAIVYGLKHPEIEEELFRVARGLPIDPENSPYNQPEHLLLLRFRQLRARDKTEILDLMDFKYLQYSKKGDKSVTEEDIKMVTSRPPIEE